MYEVITLANGRFRGCCQIQDGTESAELDTLEMACFWVIRMARQMNHELIKRTDIVVRNDKPPVRQAPTEGELDMLDGIRRKELVVLKHSDIRLALNMEQEEVDTIIGIREGECKVVPYSTFIPER